jgi:hypothetical protein
LPLKRWIVPVCAQTVRIKYETVLAFVKHAQLDTLDHTDDDDRLCTLIRPRFLNRKFYRRSRPSASGLDPEAVHA